MNIEPYSDDVPIIGPGTPPTEQIDDLIRYLVTVRHRFGNTAVNYRVRWGASALWAESEQREIIGTIRQMAMRGLVKKERMQQTQQTLREIHAMADPDDEAVIDRVRKQMA